MSRIESLCLSLRRELKIILNDKLYLSVIAILPLVAILFFVAMFYGGTIGELPLAVVDNDNTVTSRKLTSMLVATRGVRLDTSFNSLDAAERVMLQGDAVGVLYIEDGFEDRVLRGDVARVGCYLPGTSLAASGVVEREIRQCVGTLAAEISFNRILSAGVYYDKAVVDINPVNVLVNIISNPYMNYGYYLAPIFMFMAVVIFTVLSTVYAVGRELRYATVGEWRKEVMGNVPWALIGKLLPTTVAMVVMIQLVFFVLFGLMGMYCTGSYLFLSLGSVLFVIAYQSVAVFIVVMTSNLRLSLSLGGGYSVMAFTFSGITFPTMAMYGVAQLFAKLFPLSYFSNIFIDQAMRGAPVSYSMSSLFALLSFVLLAVVSMGRLNKITRVEKYWKRD